MPKETFFKLSDDKKNKIIESAKIEFARTDFDKTSIKNIVENAGIARGSFYQYFDDKEDLLEYIVKEHTNKINKKMESTLIKTKGNIFAVFLSMYDYMVTECINSKEEGFFKKIFENTKVCQESVFTIKKYKPKNILEYVEIIDTSKLNIENKSDLENIVRMLYIITRNAVIFNFKCNSKNEARKKYLRQIEYLKYGVLKGGQNV
jgi:AcrR family transcriptional regulator